MKSKIQYLTFTTSAPLKLFLFLTLCFIEFNCANKVALTGGIKDEIPPKLEYSMPAEGTVLYKNREFIFHFDEYCKLTNFQTQFISSPPLKSLPNYTIRGKSIILKVAEALLDSTTYIFDFGNSIQDITESNTLKNFQFAFSTGPFIDSLKISGKIVNAFDLNPEKNIAIMLYENLSDSAPRTIFPNYFTRSLDNGAFTLSHIKEGIYQIFALVDANGNYVFDLPTEKIAFADILIHAGKTDSITLYLFEEAIQRLHVNKIYSNDYGKILFVFNLPADSATITPLNTNLPDNWKIEEWSSKHDSITYWLPDSITDTLQLVIKTDTLIDTTFIALPSKNAGSSVRKSKQARQFKLSATSNISTVAFDLNKAIQIQFNHPISSYDFSKVILVENADTIPAQTVFMDSIHRKLQIDHKWKEETNYSLFIPDSSFIDIFDLANDTLQFNFKTKSLKQYGSATINILIQDTIPHIVQLLNEKNILITENYLTKSEKIEYMYLDAGVYKLKAIEDRNGNKKWDSGKLSEKFLPEKVFFYQGGITSRANWDIELEWNLK